MMTTEDTLSSPRDFEFAKEAFYPSSFNKSEISSLLSTSLPTTSSILKQADKDQQYDALKKKYFLSLGMNKPPVSAKTRAPSESSLSVSTSVSNSKPRTKTEPIKPSTIGTNESTIAANGIAIPKKQQPQPATNTTAAAAARVRSVSHPVANPNGVPMSLPNNLGEEIMFEEDYENATMNMLKTPTLKEEDSSYESDQLHTIQFSEEEEEDSSNSSSRRFIPPHELLAQTSSSFNVGTARSVAIWEQKRRQMMDNN